MQEEVGIIINDYKLFDADSVSFPWQYKEGLLVKVHHIGIFYQVFNYENDIKKEIKVDEVNDDSLGADYYDITKLNKKDLSAIAILELEKLGYKLK